MWKMKKNIVFFVIVCGLVLILLGCNSGKKSFNTLDVESKAMGRYIESAIELPFEMSYIYAAKFIDNKGFQILFADTEGVFRWIALGSDGESWKEVDIPENIKNQKVLKADMTLSGGIFIYLDEKDNKCIYLDADGENKEVLISLPNKEKIYNLKISNSEKLFVSTLEGSLYRIDIKTGIVEKQYGNYSSLYFLINDKLLVCNQNRWLCVNTDTLEETEELNELVENIQQNKNNINLKTIDEIPFLIDKVSDNIFYCDNTGVYNFTERGSVGEKIINGDINVMSNTEEKKLFFSHLENNEFILITQDTSSNYHIWKYTYDASTSTLPDSEITIYSLKDSDELRQMISLFRNQHKDIFVQLEIGLSGDDGITRGDAVNSLNTKILSGDGPDILIVDGLPMDVYKNKDLFYEISDLLDRVDTKEGVFRNVTNTFEDNGKNYIVPVRFYIPLACGLLNNDSNYDIHGLTNEALKIKKRNPNQDVLVIKESKILLHQLFYAYSNSWNYGEGALNEDTLKTFFTKAKELYGLNEHENEQDYADAYDIVMRKLLLDSLGNDISNYEKRRGNIVFGMLGHFNDYIRICSNLRKGIVSKIVPLETKGKKGFVPKIMMGITKNGGNKREAEKFVELFLSADIQSGLFGGFPVNKKAYTEYITQYSNAEDVYLGEEEIEKGTFVELAESEIQLLTSMLEEVNSAAITDEMIEDMILEQGSYYLLGKQDLEKTIENVTGKLKLYWMEK